MKEMYIQMFYKNSFCHIIRKKEEIMAKTSNLVVRLEPEIKEKAEAIFKKMGISASTAVDMFYRQVIVDGGMPFAAKVKKPVDLADLSREELGKFLLDGLKSAKRGELTEASLVLDELKNRSYDL